MGNFAQVTNAEYIRNVATLVSRGKSWGDTLGSYWSSQLDENNYYIGTAPFENYVYQKGAFAGIMREMSESIDRCISINLQSTDPGSYYWLNTYNSDLSYRQSLKDSWYNGLSVELKRVWDSGFTRGYMFLPGRNARFPPIWEWEFR